VKDISAAAGGIEKGRVSFVVKRKSPFCDDFF
jgi:hypothetical protein